MRKLRNVALLPMSAKPFHIGHYELIKKAAAECDSVEVYVGITSRTTDNCTITNAQMAPIWQHHIIPILPANVCIYFVNNPQQAVVENMQGILSYNLHVYCGSDRAHKFNKQTLPQNTHNFTLHTLDRKIIEASGTAVRQAISRRDFERFQNQMPSVMNIAVVWSILTN